MKKKRGFLKRWLFRGQRVLAAKLREGFVDLGDQFTHLFPSRVFIPFKEEVIVAKCVS
jgi:hypothetical protein